MEGTYLHDQRAHFSPEEWLLLTAAIGSNLPCDPSSCACPRMRDLVAGCGCYHRQGCAGCACSLLELTTDDRFLAFILAWRRCNGKGGHPNWHADDSADDAEPISELGAG